MCQQVAPAQRGIALLSAAGNQQAIEPFEVAAARRDPAAAERLGDIFSSGDVGPKDYKLAAAWYRVAFALGRASAAAKLGALYAGGLGVRKDPLAAVELLGYAARSGDADAFYRLGRIADGAADSVSGRLVAYVLFSLGAALGSREAAEAGAKLSASLRAPERGAAQAAVGAVWSTLGRQ
ncbi:MAG: tetratricopeptide repeat protein [Terriglobales bacterium]